MNGKKAAAAALLLVCFALSFPFPTASQSGIIVTGAESVLNTSFTYSSDLVDTTLSIGPRVIAEYAKSALRHVFSEMPTTLQTLVNAVSARVVVEYASSTDPHALIEVPTALQALVSTVSQRVVVEYANSTGPHALIEIPTALQALVSTVSERIVVEYANSTRGMGLAYPLELMNDTQSPEITGVSATEVTTNTATIAWTTDEFTDSLVQYGLQPGGYTETVQDSLFVKDHAVALSGLSPEMIYYFMVSSTDQSGNPASSTEYSLSTPSPAAPEFFVYLPLILRNH